MERRNFVSGLLAAPFLAWAGALIAKAAPGATDALPQFPTQNPSRFPPQLPGAQSQTPGKWPTDNSQFPPIRINRHAILVHNQKEIRKDVAKLYSLAGKLQKQVTHTNSAEVLSLDMIHTANEIEKLAKHIKNLAKG